MEQPVIQPKAGETVPLKVTQEARHRIFAGLSWEASDTKPSAQYYAAQFIDSLWILIKHPRLINRFRENTHLLYQKDDQAGRETDDPNFDLDLACFAFGKDGSFKSFVDPSAYNAIDPTEKMYHSGDNMDGVSSVDDEQIHIELKGIEQHYNHFFVVIESDCMHRLSDVGHVKIRLADAMTDASFLECDLSTLKGNNNYSFVFCHVFQKDGAWHLKNISEFVDDNRNWSEFLKKYL